MNPDLFLFFAALGCYIVGAGAAVLCARRDALASLLSFGPAMVGGICGALAAIGVLAGGGSARATLFSSPLLPASLEINLDPLGAFFLLLVSLLALAISAYSLGYVKGFFGRKSVAVLGSLYNLLLLSTSLVFLAANAFFFLLVWELMALSAYALVSFEHEKEESRRAGVLFFIMSHLGTACLLAGFLILFQACGSWDFDAFHQNSAALSPTARNAAFILFLLGFGVKAGMVPLHIWLPAAHPVAPSNISAFMSGVVIKTGIYGMARLFFDCLGSAPPLWWGVTVLVLGTCSALLGVLYALMEHDLKRLLAYHSIENIGIILMGFGASLMFSHSGHPLLACLALLAGLYHTLNHATFKGLLFLGAGAVLHSTHTRNMEEMGGLIRRMPWTAFFFLVGAVAISALPPLNGFVSEWLTYQALLQGFGTNSDLVQLVYPISGALLALTGALAAACFVKAFGITFLAQPRSQHATEAHEASLPMLLGMATLTVACFVLGLFPGVLLRLLDPVTGQLLGEALSTQLISHQGLVLSALDPQLGSVSTLGLLLMFACLLPIPLGLWWVLARASKTTVGPTWDCGLRGLTPRMEYTATGFSKPTRMIFRVLFRPRREIQAEFEFSRYFARTIRFESRIEETFEERVYRPLNALVYRWAKRVRLVQAGNIQAYLIYIFVTLLLLLMFAL